MRIDKCEIVSALRNLGVRRGDWLGLHSNIPALGRVMVDIQKSAGREGVYQAVNDIIDAFLQAVDPDCGLLMVPTFTDSFEGHKQGMPYHPEKTKSRVGMLTDLFFRRPDARRSLQPTHSVACIGAQAEKIVTNHENRTALGIDSPFHRLAQAGGWICNLGTNCKTLSLLHVAEIIAQAPYANTFCYETVGWKPQAVVEQEDGTITIVPLREIPGCSGGFGKFDELMNQAAITRTRKMYQAKVTLFKAQKALDLAVDKLKQDPWWLLCSPGTCPQCDFRRKAVAKITSAKVSKEVSPRDEPCK